jgi:hypothetical protein
MSSRHDPREGGRVDHAQPAWHQALAYAVTGVRFEELGRQARPDLAVVAAFLRARLGGEVELAELRRPHPLPPELAEGLGAAQLAAAVADLRARLVEAPARPVARDRALTADERRLLADVPPHHGS